MPVRVISTFRDSTQCLRKPHTLGNVFGTFSSPDRIKSNSHSYELLLIYSGDIANCNTPTMFYSWLWWNMAIIVTAKQRNILLLTRSWRWWSTGKPGVLQSMGLESRTWLSNWTTKLIFYVGLWKALQCKAGSGVSF